MYCVYKTTYAGELLPKFYVGSTHIKNIESGYLGSVSSKKWKSIWDSEISANRDLFSIEIISLHFLREDATYAELLYQLENDVVKSDIWINESLAKPNGFFGRDVSGERNPRYGSGNEVIEWCKNNKDKVAERNRKSAKTQWDNPETRSKKISSMKGKPKHRKTQTQEEFLQSQRKKLEKARLVRQRKIEFYGDVYYGWESLKRETGVSKDLYNKYYGNGIDPRERIGKYGPNNKK